MPMYDPPHPGGVLESCFIDEKAIEDAIETTGIPRDVFWGVIHGTHNITPEIAFMLTKAIPLHSPSFWIDIQADYDKWQTAHNISWQEKVQKKFRNHKTPVSSGNI